MLPLTSPTRARWAGWPVALLLACTPVGGPTASSPDGGPPTSAPSARGGGAAELLWYVPAPEARPSPACETNLCRSLVALVDGANDTLDLAFYGVRNAPEVIRAIDRARARGVRVRGVVDRSPDGTNVYEDTDAFVRHLDAVADDGAYERRVRRRSRRRSTAPRADRCPRPPGTRGPLQCLAYDLGDRCLLVAQAADAPFGEGGAIMHDKFALADGRRLWTGSANVSDTGIGGYNANVVVRIDSRAVGARYQAYFDDLFRGRFHVPFAPDAPRPEPIALDGGTVEVFFAPRDGPMTRGLRPVVRRARERIDVAVFFLTHKHLTQDLVDAHLRGVAVRVVLDATGARNAYSKHHVLRAAGIPVKVETFGGKMHMKATAVDGEVLVVGSMNYTGAGERTNDENVLVLRHPALARQMHDAFDALWNSLDDATLQRDADPESRESGSACEDGTDNDHDGLTDADDPGCRRPEPAPTPLLRSVPKPAGGTCHAGLWRDGAP